MHAGPGSDHAGFLLNDAHDVVFEESSTYDTASSGIGVWASRNVTIARNDVDLACNGGQQECITVAGTAGFDVVNNRVHGAASGAIGGEGIDVKDGSRHGRVRGNEIFGLRNRLGIYVDAWDKHTFDVEVDGNLVHDIENADGIVLASEMGGLLENIRVTNNVVVRNNVVGGNASFQIVVAPAVPAASVSVDHNLIDGFRGDEGETRGKDYVEGNPRFLAPGNDFRLAEGSPAIDRGLPAGAPDADLDAGSGRRGRASTSALSSARRQVVIPDAPLAPIGAAGLSYAGVPLARMPLGPVVLCGLAADSADRSNVAVQNAGGAGEGDVTLRVTLVSGGTDAGRVPPGPPADGDDPHEPRARQHG